MPSKESHIRAATENGRVIEYLQENGNFPQWVVTVAFYKALHIVEAVFAADSNSDIKHTDNHAARCDRLKTVNRYQKIWKHYRPLWNDSLLARYLTSAPGDVDECVFSEYMSNETLEKVHLNHHLVQIVKSARKLLEDPKFMEEISVEQN